MALGKRRNQDLQQSVTQRACGSCGQDLTGAPLNQPCPECGWRPSILCVGCGYDLAGLDEQGPCPECGTPIAESIRGDGLAFADTGYLRTLSRGLHMVRWSVSLVLLTWIGGIITLVAISAAGVQVPSWVEDAVITGLMLASCCLYVVGWWVATTPDPRDEGQGQSRAAIIARYGSIAIIAAVACMLVLGNWLAGARDAVRIAMLLAFIVQHGAGSLYLHQIAQRAANARAAKLARNAAVAIATLATAWTIDAILDALNISPPWGSGGGATVLRLAMSLLGLTMFIAGIVAIARQFTAAGLVRKDIARFLGANNANNKTQKRPEGR
ncbi:MAG: hypothetical protein RIB58_11105 [Phycisphaerales bacterium]